MKSKITVSQIRKIAELWKENNRITMKEMRGSPREFYRGFSSACLSFQDLIDGKIDGAIEGANKTKPSSDFKYLYFGQFPDREILETDEYKACGKSGKPLKWTIFEDTGRRTSEFVTFIYRRKITLTKGGARQEKGKS